MDAPGFDREIGFLQRAHAAVALGDTLHREQTHGLFPAALRRAVEHRRAPLKLRSMQTGECGAPPRGPCMVAYLFASVCPMISCAVKLMPQVGNALPTKKL